MIHVDWGNAPDSAPNTGPEAAAALAAGLRAAGHAAGLAAAGLPAGLSASQACLLAPLIAPAPPGPRDRLLVLSGPGFGDARLADLRRLAGRDLGPCVVAGAFDSRQAEIATAAKFAYALDRDPVLLPLHPAERGLWHSPVGPVIGVDLARRPDPGGALRVLLVGPEVEGGVRSLQALAAARRLKVTILTDGESKGALRASGLPLAVYHYGEVPLSALAAAADAAVFCRPVPRSYPMRRMLADLARSGAALLDAAPGFANRAQDPAFLPAPADPAALAAFLSDEVRPDLADLSDLSRGSAIAARTAAALEGLLTALDLPLSGAAPARPRRSPAGEGPPRVLFLPTNGVGLGHAQRCSLIAGDLAAAAALRPVFAAFPSCLRLIRSRGFDVAPLVQKTGRHAEPFANDVVNSQRLDALLPGCGAFVFDGGYVFASVLRAVVQHRVPAVWVRRGLWQAGQDNALALDREKLFQRVIVPLEAFEELNAGHATGPQVTQVGPIVAEPPLRPDQRAALRAALAGRYGLAFRHLVVTMLGGGVAADRSAQTAALAAGLSRRRDVLHLVVVWPTATVDPGLFGWPNTRIVRTHHASVLTAACDLWISAVGYNSFHEALYGRIPTIFVPQMAAFMDDQRARARAAADRGVAHLVEPHQIDRLDRLVERCLDRGETEELRTRLAGLDLPEPGTAAAAAAIARVAGAGGAPVTLQPRRIA